MDFGQICRKVTVKSVIRSGHFKRGKLVGDSSDRRDIHAMLLGVVFVGCEKRCLLWPPAALKERPIAAGLDRWGLESRADCAARREPENKNATGL
jgi:hypothetical protein